MERSFFIKQLSEKMNKIRMAAGNALEFFFRKIKNNKNLDSIHKNIKNYNLLQKNFLLSVDEN